MSENIIKIKNISKKFQKNNEEVQILNDVNLDIKKGEFITIVGKSGCGKSTLLKLISGMVPITEGEILINDKSVNGVSKDCSMIFQDARLFPWLKIKDNVAIGLKNISSEKKNRIVLEYLELVGLKGVENSYPDQLSGGMAQRASIARGLALNSQIMLFKVKNSTIQARELVKRIFEINPNETIGVLYRNNISSLYVAEMLKNNDIDFFVKENKFDFYSNRILNDVKNILLFSEDTTDLEVFKRIYFKLNAYIKKDFITKLEYKPYNQCVLESLLDLDELNDFYLNKFTSLRNDFKRLKRMKMEDKIDCILYELGYGDYLDNFNEFSNLNYNLIFDLIKYLSKDLKTFDEFIEKLDNLKELLKNASSSKSNISISTIHSSKGLEYDNVFIIDLIDGEFPQKSILNSFDEKLLEEERRLFYVAMTRARKRLFLYTIKERNNLPVEPSIFYNELKNKY